MILYIFYEIAKSPLFFLFFFTDLGIIFSKIVLFFQYIKVFVIVFQKKFSKSHFFYLTVTVFYISYTLI